MNQQPDKLFRDKLQGYSAPAPTRAWDKIEANLDKKEHKGGWWKVAASLLLLAVSGYIVWSVMRQSPAAPSVARTEEPAGTTPAPSKDVIKKEDILPPDTQSAPEPIAKAEKNQHTKQKKQSSINTTVNDSQAKVLPSEKTEAPSREASQSVNTSTESTVSEEATVLTEEAVNTTIASAEQPSASPMSQNITLVFRTDETDDYRNKNITADATEEDKKPSTFKKLLKKAQDLKNNQDPLGELRQKKNEILALSFKNEKRGQNK